MKQSDHTEIFYGRHVTRITGGTGSLSVMTQLNVPHRCAEVWNVITDYDNLEEFMPNLKSRKVDQRGSSTIVEQTATSSLIPLLTFRLNLEFTTESPTRLRFRRLAGNLSRFDGFWSVNPTSGGTLLQYQLEAKHSWPIPRAILSRAVRNDVAQIMPSIARELQRRHGLQGQPLERSTALSSH